VQTWKHLGNGGGVRITTARWLTPEGNWVHEDGLMPDILVTLPDTIGGENGDKQLQAAINHIIDIQFMDSGAD
jgi:carboxyl-terminal processing protease